tara:strand:+ start:138 stop:260 length:123 start_codon:yes stop_codon:yes gene_type:complete
MNKILIAEDDLPTRILVEELLKKEGSMLMELKTVRKLWIC